MSAVRGSGPVVIIAGSGDLPLRLADRLVGAGRECRILALRGFASRALRARADAAVGLLDARGALACLERWNPACVTLAGGLRRPDLGAVLDAYSAFRSRDELSRLLARGDDNLLRGALGLLEERGFQLAGIPDLAPELLAPAGPLGARAPGDAAASSIPLGLSLLATLSPFDIGQSVVVSGRRVLAVEGPEGTDRMIARVRRLDGGLLSRPVGGGVLVKAPKAGQDLRIDLPAIGPRTVANAAKAGLSGIAIASGLTIVVDQAETVRAADRLGLFVYGCGPVLS